MKYNVLKRESHKWAYIYSIMIWNSRFWLHTKKNRAHFKFKCVSNLDIKSVVSDGHMLTENKKQPKLHSNLVWELNALTK